MVLLYALVSGNLELKRTVSRLTWGVVDTLAVLLLHNLALGAAFVSTPGRSSRTVSSAAEKADLWGEALISSFEKAQLKSCWQNLRRRGLVESIEGKRYEAKITKLGLEKLNSAVPFYRSERFWDKRIYIINYDIEEKVRFYRDKLRKYLREIGCGLLQKSTYISVYNPRGLLRQWIAKHHLAGEILISDLGPDGSLGDKSVSEIVTEVYELNILNSRYNSFLNDFSRGANYDGAQKAELIFKFTSILKSDPQLPFELLPDWWVGDKAYQKYKTLIGI